jgi:hypothetical protein
LVLDKAILTISMCAVLVVLLSQEALWIYNVSGPLLVQTLPKVALLTLTLTLNLRQHHSLQEWHNGTDNGKS